MVLRRLICTLLLSSVAAAGWAGDIPVDLTELSLEELMDIEITSVSKKEERLFEAAAAVFAITGEEIRRSGVTSIPEALRMVPGMQVARIDANKWAVTSRGFNGRFANKLLVLIDGRSIYTPVFSGVYWDMHDVLMEDVERIEVIRGPGATLWGANAVNGIVNIITRSAKDTQGNLVILGAGSEERGFGGFRYGGKLGDDTYYRVHAKYFDRDSFAYESGEEGADGWDVLWGGWRMDWEVSGSDLLTLKGDIYDGDVGQAYRMIDSLEPPFERTLDHDAHVAAGNVLGRWEHIFSGAQDLALQFYYDRAEREEAVVVGIANTFDVDFQHRFGLCERQEVMWGLGYRLTSDEIDGAFAVSFDPEGRDYQLISAFVQDEIAYVEERLRLTLGSKFEYNDYTGFEIQPNARLLWKSHERHTAWGAISRAVRTPSRADDDMRAVIQAFPPGLVDPAAPAAFVAIMGSRDFESEELLAFELGYRVRPTDPLFLDVAMFYDVYDKLRTFELGTPFLETSPAPEHLIVPAIMDNKMGGETFGVELTADWRVLDRWRLRVAYTYLQMQLYLDEDSEDTFSEDVEEASPRHQLSLRSSMDLAGSLELDMEARYVDDLPSFNVRSYFNIEIRLGWNPVEHLEVSVVGQNLLDNHHAEFATPAGLNLPAGGVTFPTEVERGVYGAIRWRF